MLNKTLIALATAAAFALPAQAASLTGVSTDGPVVAEDFSADGLISFDLDFLGQTTATLSYRITDADLAGMGVSFNAVLRNFASLGFTGYDLSLNTGSFDPVGTVTRQFGGDALVSFNGAQAAVRFDSPEFLDVEIGDPLALGFNQVDWLISGVNAGERLSITVTAVPEPGTYAMLLAGLGLMGWMARRRA
jgi:PEP-CTERM motif